MKDFLRAFRYFRPDAPRIAVVFSLLLASIGLNVLKPWPLAFIIDSVLQDHPLPGWLHWLGDWSKTGQLAFFSATILLLHFTQGALSAVQNFQSIQVSLRGLTRVRNEVFGWLQRLSLRARQGSREGDLIFRASWDTYSFQTMFQQGLMTFVAALVSLVMMGVVMARMNLLLTIVALALAPLLFAAIRYFGRKMSERTASAQQADSRATSLVQQSISSLLLTQSYTREESEAARFESQAAEAQQRRLAQHGWELIYWFAIAMIFGAGAAAVTWLGSEEVLRQQLTIGELMMFLTYLGQLYEPLNQLSQIGATVSGAGAGVRRVFELLDTPEEVKDKPNARRVISAKAAKNIAPSGSDAPLLASGRIDFEGVAFNYAPDRVVLHDLTFSLPPGDSVAIIGPSGVGKTTLLHLLPRFFDPDRGAVKLDGADLRDLRLKDLRAQVALVLQEPIILPASVAENIAYGKPGASRDEIEAAARAANADVFIQKMPQKYESLLGEGGARLSVGERQRINLARAFLKDAPVLLLDEPTSALDADSEMLVTQSLAALMQGRTTLMVAHRLSTIGRMSRVMVLEDGALSEFGTHAELRERGGYYTRVVSGQVQLE